MIINQDSNKKSSQVDNLELEVELKKENVV